jgi:8-oxo-dGTP pyrophosphatase MutT (NUDIX family)
MADQSDTLGRRSTYAARSGRGHPRSLQVAALCWRVNGKGKLRILLITSRETRRWVLPKGWPMRKRSVAGSAEREAWEEAGVKGRLCPDSIGFYHYNKRIDSKRSIPCIVKVFPLKVTERVRKYPETGQRKAHWFTRKKAGRKVREPELAALLRDFDPRTIQGD